MYQLFASLQRHLDLGKHLVTLERETLFTGGVPAEERDGDHKANLRDVAMRMKGMRDSSRKKRFQKKK